MRKLVTAGLVSSVLLLTACSLTPNNAETTAQVSPFQLIEEVASLPVLDLASVDNYKKYSDFADAANTLIKILNEKAGGRFNIPEVEPSVESFEKASRFVTKYGPLIGNYNDVINTARQVQDGSAEAEDFYKSAAIFGFEVGVIYTGLFYPMSFDIVGTLYRDSGLNRWAFECPECISFVLKQAHWALRTALVEGSSKQVEAWLDGVNAASLKSSSSNAADKAKKFFKDLMGGN